MKLKHLLLITCYLLLVPVSVSAQTSGLKLAVSPLPINLVTDPNSTVTADLRVKNEGSTTEKIRVGLMKFSAFGESGSPRLLDRESGDNYFDWVKFSEDSFDVAPGEWKTLTMTLTVPESASFGYYYAVTFSRDTPSVAKTSQPSTSVIGATAVLVLLEVRVPNAIRKVDLLDFSVSKKIFEFLPAQFSFRLKNSGNVHLVPKGNLFITSGQKTLAVLPVNDTRGNILPDSNRIYDVFWKDGFPLFSDQKDPSTHPTLQWDFSQVPKLRFGKYTASLVLIYDDGQRDIPLESKVSFWVVPWRLIFGGIGVFVVYEIIRKIILRSLIKRKSN